MQEAAEQAGRVAMVGFCRRFAAPARLAHELVASGKLGEIRHFRCHLCVERISYPEVRLEWRLVNELGTYGALGDLASHGIDWARFLVGPRAGKISSVLADGAIFIKQRQREDSDAWGEVTGWDAVSLMLTFANGARGVIECSRFTPGEEFFQVDGSLGSVRYSGGSKLGYYPRRGSDTQQTVSQWSELETDVLPVDNPLASEFAQFIRAIETGEPASPNFADGLAACRVRDAAQLSIIEERKVNLAEVAV